MSAACFNVTFAALYCFMCSGGSPCDEGKDLSDLTRGGAHGGKRTKVELCLVVRGAVVVIVAVAWSCSRGCAGSLSIFK